MYTPVYCLLMRCFIDHNISFRKHIYNFKINRNANTCLAPMGARSLLSEVGVGGQDCQDASGDAISYACVALKQTILKILA